MATTRCTVRLAGLQLRLEADETGLTRISFLRRGAERADRKPHDPILGRAVLALEAWAEGRRVRPPPLVLGRMPPFLRRVLEECRRIPRGRTVSYGELARRCGRPRAARAVGQAMARNPLPILIPCHRVVAAIGVGGFSPGLDLKRRIWRIEGIPWAEQRG